MNLKSLEQAFTQMVKYFEWLLAGIIIVAVVAEGTMLIHDLFNYITEGKITEKFQDFLAQALLYIIGLEVALMLIKHDMTLVMDIIIFAIARKMIILNVHMWEILVGILAILILYYLKCYGLSCRFFPSRT
ncbi:phosphate-starvation-inducible PsiE family protein [Ammoniphilus sp. YIM 78166]|uniref:phosphate-starvation-inducible PsiE family protein n=1 Tax=Ammoniphilus sp. YIM 78166 TaxID=1644106 RepID=UPI0010703D08|nr:phosphate-starvation-inducible PsiE family protein [Ammoniphilus sp. YIM 78166]